ncbi:MAG TPA: transposase family protein, partial [Candidatus Competibacteraceae bacterium]|nr:transposase family protein [Candidatus Competibacteraceae bacterium]
MLIDQLIEHFSELDDPRCPGKVEHRLIDILVIAVCAVIAGAESWED